MANPDLLQRYDQLVRRSVVGMFSSTLEGQLLECNDSMSRMLGHARKEILMDLPLWAAFLHAPERDRVLHVLHAHGRILNARASLRHASGRPVQVLLNLALNTNPGGRATIDGTIIDVTDLAAEDDARPRARAQEPPSPDDPAPGPHVMPPDTGPVQRAEEVTEVLRAQISDHQRTQEALRASRRFARSLVDSSLDVIIAVDRQGCITEFNPAASQKFAYRAEEVLGRRTGMLYASNQEYQRVQQELDRHGSFAGEVENVDRSGRRFTSFMTASRLYDEEGSLIGSMGISRDITQAKSDQDALRASEERYRDLFENATDLIQSVDADGRVLFVNNAWRSTLGYAPEEVARLRIADVVHPEDRDEFMSLRKRMLEGENVGAYTIRMQARDGRTVIVRGSSSVRYENGRPTATRTIFRDITGEEAAREAVADHLAKQRALFESGAHMFWTVDRRIALTSFNRGYADMVERLYGTRPEVNTDLDIPRKRFASDEYHAFWESRYQEAFTGRPIRFETERSDQQGRRVCNEIFLSPVFGPDGSVDEVYGIGHEVTEQREAEDLARAQSARLNAIFENSANMMIWTLDRRFRITAMNRHFQLSSMRGMGISFALGDDFIAPIELRVAGGRAEPFVNKYRQALLGQPQQFEVELKNHRGRSLWVETFLNPITLDGEVTEISCLAYGITDKKDAQARLLESLHEKEVLLKEVHHRVKNNLQIISSIFNLQKPYVGDHPRALELLRDSQDRVRSMSFIHESLYQTKNFSHVDLATYIDGLTRNLMMSYSLSGKVELVKDLVPVDLGLDQAIPCGLILNELISNALKHAFPKEEGRIHLQLRAEGPLVEMVIEDDGPGLPAGFDVERDANLGLQLVQTLIGQLGGRIERRTPSIGNGRGVGYFLTFERTGITKQA